MASSPSPAWRDRLGALDRFRLRRPGPRGIVAIAAAVLVAGVLVFAALVLAPVRGLDLHTLRTLPGEGSVVYDRTGRELGRFFVENRHVVKLADLPRVVPQAFVAIEDARFYEHHGVDWWRTGGAFVANLTRGNRGQGGSTLTMQLARNVYPDLLPRSKSFVRKFREMAVARALEHAFSKDHILEAYLNTIYLGAGAYGIDAAAHTYFDKSAAELALPEAALLAALPKAPTSLNPFTNPDGARERRDLVLDRMVEAKAITPAEAQRAKAAPLGVVKTAKDDADERRATTDVGPYFVEFVRRRLQARFGDTLYRGGLKIYTTLDHDLQQQVEQAVEAQAERVERGQFGRLDGPRRGRAAAGVDTAAGTPYLQAGAVVIDADSGDVLAMVGGRSFEDSPYNRMTQAHRQPGSAFKTFVYAAALAAGESADSLVNDDPITVQVDDSTVWKPANFELDAMHSGGTVTLKRAFMQSRNRAAVRLAQQVGIDQVRATARRAGLTDSLPAVPSLALGTADVRPIDLVVAYAPFIRGDGHRLLPRFVTTVVGPEGDTIYTEPVRAPQGLDSVVALGVRDLLASVVDHGTGWPVRQSGFTGPAAGKTGTTNGSTDLWFVGGVPHLLGGVWFGFDQPREILGGEYGTGGQIAAPLWATIMRAARKRLAALRGEKREIAPWPGNWQPRAPVPAAVAVTDSVPPDDSLGGTPDSAAVRGALPGLPAGVTIGGTAGGTTGGTAGDSVPR